MAELAQPTSERVRALIVLVADANEKEILHRLQANLTQGARYNHDDVARYVAMWCANEEAGNKEIEVQRKQAEVDKAAREKTAKDAEAAAKTTKPSTKPGTREEHIMNEERITHHGKKYRVVDLLAKVQGMTPEQKEALKSAGAKAQAKWDEFKATHPKEADAAAAATAEAPPV